MRITELCEHKGDTMSRSTRPKAQQEAAPQSAGGGTWKLTVGELTYFVNGEIVAQFRLEKGQELTREELAKIRSADVLRKAKNRALYLLGERDMCLAELTKKLTKTYGEEVAVEAAEYVQGLGYINDERYAPKLAEYLIKRKKYGKRRAKQEMLYKGLDRELIEEALSKIPEDEISEGLADLIERKYANKLADYKDRQKVIAALARRGYSFDEIKRALEDRG